MYIWLNGNILKADEVTVNILSSTLHYGIGVFEGERAYLTADGPSIFRLDAHTERLFRSANIIGMDIPFNEQEISAATRQVVRVNNYSAAYIRPLVFYGHEHIGFTSEGLSIHVAIAAFPRDTVFGSLHTKNGLRVQVSKFKRVHSHPDLNLVKATGNYLGSVLAHRAALACGFDEALLLDNEDYISEGARENIFVVINGIICTPKLNSALPGITRDTIIRLAHDNGIAVYEIDLSVQDLMKADEAFFTGSGVEIMAIKSVDNCLIGDGFTGPITQLLFKLYHAAVSGCNQTYTEWNTPC